MTPSSRQSKITRDTSETIIQIELDLDDSETKAQIDTSVPFFDHMLHQVARFSGIAMKVQAKGDTNIDLHHTIEDIGITLGQALTQALGDKIGICRYADRTVPLDESLTRVVIDISGRPGLHGDRLFTRDQINGFELDLINEFLHGLTNHARITIHADIIRGRNAHHQAESLFKGLGLALGDAIRRNRGDDIPSTKGSL